MVLVDIENLTGTPSPSASDVCLAVRDLQRLVPNLEEAHVVVACSHHAAPVVAFAWRGVRHLWRSGPDGADLALLTVLEDERVHERFASVTVCSGDGMFSDIAGWLGGQGVEVTVIALEGHLSTRLRLAAGVTREVPLAAHAADGGGVA